MNKNLGIEDYEVKEWITALGSMPIERIAHEDVSELYEMAVAHVFRLENGRYALVTEEGCSCYSSSDAVIDLFPTKRAAMEAFNKWEQDKNH